MLEAPAGVVTSGLAAKKRSSLRRALRESTGLVTKLFMIKISVVS